MSGAQKDGRNEKRKGTAKEKGARINPRENSEKWRYSLENGSLVNKNIGGPERNCKGPIIPPPTPFT
jgi:hypothetical protein